MTFGIFDIILNMKVGIDYIGVTTPFYCHDGKGKFLLHKRSKECRDEHHRWDPGSGSLEHGLSIEENILKEVEEEYGCKGLVQEILPAHDIFREQGGVSTHWIAIPGFVKVNPNEVINNEPHKIIEIGWFSLDNLPNPLLTGFAHTYGLFEDYFKKYS